MSERDKLTVTFRATVAAVVLLAVYVGAYLWMVKPIPYNILAFAPPDLPRGHSHVVYLAGPDGRYLEDQKFWSTVFAPANALDRKLRPGKWRER